MTATSPADRTITIHLPHNIDPDKYADIANGVWMLVWLTAPPGASVSPDGQADNTELNKRWNRYAHEAQWGEA